MFKGKKILLVVGGGVAAYKACDLIRRLQENNAQVQVVLSKGGAEFVTPLSLAALSGNKVYQELFSLNDESEIGHIKLARDCDLVLVVPATANLIARMSVGMADELATTVLLATDKPILIAPSMNVVMWENKATQANVALLEKRGVKRIGPNKGYLACKEEGAGRLAEIGEILAAVKDVLLPDRPLDGIRVLVTSGPTREAIDPVRYISNHSSGKQGHAIAETLAAKGALVTLVSGPVDIPSPSGVRLVKVESARQMLEACLANLPLDCAIFAAAVADWRVDNVSEQKIKKEKGSAPPSLQFTQNPDILATIAGLKDNRPNLVIGFAAETENVIPNAQKKLISKKCDFICANDVSTGVFGGDSNQIHLVGSETVESWPPSSKKEAAERLVAVVVNSLKEKN